MKESQKKPVVHNIVLALGIFISIAVIVLAVLQISGVWEDAVNVFVPLMGLSQLCQVYIQWNNSRKTAYFNIGTAAFILVCSIIIFIVK